MNIGIIGTGNWGTTVAHMISKNVLKNKDKFNKDIIIWGIQEEYNNQTMSDLINKEHENKKYLPNIKLGDNIKYTDKEESFKDIDIIIVALPHQFINTLYKFIPHLKEDIIVLSVIKGVLEGNVYPQEAEYVQDGRNVYKEDNVHKEGSVYKDKNVYKDDGKYARDGQCSQQEDNVYKSTYKEGGNYGSFSLVSEHINKIFKCTTNTLMGANIARDVARGINGDILYKSEGTLGYSKESDKEILYSLLTSEAYKISCTKDLIGVELCGSLKNIIALGYGVTEGLGCSKNTSIFYLRRGFLEMKKFLETFYPSTSSLTLFESCGIADLIVSITSGRNYKYGKAKAEENISEGEFEERIGNQKIQGVGTVNCVYNYVLIEKKLEEFPIFVGIWKIFCDNGPCEQILQTF
ncbi:glycerol-3-phosphate dehydrogenase [NAD(+)] [Vairimorpha necatrix]|uniref:Glycerol-3-phosphate dehydrogenase [NAD(+)] n=1 Tax=Vairimorpha necatrix TaxID=6039 RepID=A0AAX4JEY1_9MICR